MKIAFITIVGAALLVLATGAWVADGLRAVRGTGRRRRAERAAEHQAPAEARRRRGPGRFVPEDPDRFAVA